MKIVNPRAKIFQLGLDYDKRMAEIGHEEFRSENPKKAVCLVVAALYPQALKAQVENDLEYQPSLKKDWKCFLKHTSDLAEQIQMGMDSVPRLTTSSSQTYRDKPGINDHKRREASEKRSSTVKRTNKNIQSGRSDTGKT